MGKFFEAIPEDHIAWIHEQHMFWVATAPLSAEGHVNVSPKGIGGTFHVMDNRHFWYEDLTGSGIETISHLRENGRITILFNAFSGPPRICRLFGKGVSHEIGTPVYESLLPFEKRNPGSRAVIMVDIHKVGTSCGYAVPFYSFQSDRNTLMDSASSKERKDTETGQGGEGGMKHYWRHKNAKSIDGLVGLETAPSLQIPLRNKPWRRTQAVQDLAPEAVWISTRYLAVFIAGCVAMQIYWTMFGQQAR